ncbi:hypothetical protein EJA03_07165 [Vibrio pectenicida]|uniref:HTH luxR-type domain-containing protein n=1 Tax=Vibrio pectenicida TaxID=62763 RepID=A0A3R9L2W8_9VIBR|nr:hypothetical protein EJA03_07165 [Vibrio pectenicida]
MKVSFVLGSFCQEGSLYFNEVKDKAVIKFSKYMLKKYIHEISVEMEEVKLSPLIFNPETIAGQLFNDSPIEKPNYGELSCLSLAKDGIDVTEISKITGYKVSTVHSNLKNARLKLGAKKTIDAAIKAINLGWIA